MDEHLPSGDNKPIMHEHYPTESVEALLAAQALADGAAALFDELGTKQGKSPLTDEEKSTIFNMLRGGASYFYDLSRQAGELAGEGNAIGALALLGGEQNARDLIGNEETDTLLKEVERQSQRELQFPPEPTGDN